MKLQPAVRPGREPDSPACCIRSSPPARPPIAPKPALLPPPCGTRAAPATTPMAQRRLTSRLECPPFQTRAEAFSIMDRLLHDRVGVACLQPPSPAVLRV